MEEKLKDWSELLKIMNFWEFMNFFRLKVILFTTLGLFIPAKYKL